MTEFPTLPLQKALWARLNNAVTLDSKTIKVYDIEARDNTLVPFIVIGEEDVTWAGTKQDDIYEISVAIYVATEAQGKSTAKKIHNQIFALLHRQSLTVEDWNCMDVIMSGAASDLQGKPDRHISVANYTFILEAPLEE
jgi:hypothetical protein